MKIPAVKFSETRILSRKWGLVKRLIDLIFGLIFFTLLFPVIVVCAAILRLETPGNPIFTQRRVGKNGKMFTIYKMRTLYKEHFGLIAEQEEPADYRITPIGKYLRRSKIDELPQLLNIILGNMSFVGPRPHTPNEFDFDKNADANRLLAKPGLTGISQISGNKSLSKPDIAWLDIWYIQNFSIYLDIKIILLTLLLIINGEADHDDPFNLHYRLPVKNL